MLTLIRKPVALATLITATIIGIASMTLFMVFLYAGPFNWVILDINEAGRLVFNTALSSVFFLQHSGMVRKPFRRRLERIIPPHYQGVLYTIASGLIVIAIFALWQSSNLIIEVSGLPRGVMRACFFLSILGTFWGFWALHPIDFSYMLGLKPILNNLRVKPSFPMPLRILGPLPLGTTSSLLVHNCDHLGLPFADGRPVIIQCFVDNLDCYRSVSGGTGPRREFWRRLSGLPTKGADVHSPQTSAGFFKLKIKESSLTSFQRTPLLSYDFTEHGAIIAAHVLHSPRTTRAGIFVDFFSC